MRPVQPCYLIDSDDRTDAQVQATGRCHVRFGDLVLVFPTATDAEAALDEASLALRLQTVGRQP